MSEVTQTFWEKACFKYAHLLNRIKVLTLKGVVLLE